MIASTKEQVLKDWGEMIGKQNKDDQDHFL